MVNVLWDERAQSRHEEWAFSILMEFSSQHMESYLDNIDHAVQVIGNNPLVGTEVSVTGNRFLRRFVTSIGYNVFYELDSADQTTKVKIISVVRSSR